MDKKEKVAIAIIKKWFRKGNITRCMRDILPNSNLNLIDREEVAKIIHDIVRWKRWYDFLIEFYDMERNAETYFKIAINEYDLDYEKAEKEIPKEKYVAIRYSFSDFLANYLKNKPEFINHLNKEAKTTLCINFNKGNKEKIIGILRNEKINAYESEYVETAILTESRARYSKVVKEGYAHIQDESSQLISKITANYGKKILDYCAGNGGKTLAIASITRNEADIYVNDVNERKLDILKKRAMLFNANVKMMEKGKYDVVLVDAPCAGVGAARRNPEAKYIDSLNNFPKKQYSILKNAWKYVKKNGFLIYSICSFLPEEINVIKKIDGEHIELNIKGLKKVENGYYIWLPEGDIFFISILKK